MVDIVRELTDDEATLMGRMEARIGKKRRVNMLRSRYHDASQELEEFGLTSKMSIPAGVRNTLRVPVGWCEKAVTVPASRIRPDGFTSRAAGSLADDIDDLIADGRHEALERQWVRSSMQTGVAFAFVNPPLDGGDGYPVRTVRPATEASAEFDPRTGEVVAALEHVDGGRLLYLPGYVLEVQRTPNGWGVVNGADRPGDMVACTPLPWQGSVEHPFGRSRITQPLMGLTDTGVRTLFRQEVTADAFSAPRIYGMGFDESMFKDEKGNRIDPLSAMTGGIWALPDRWDEDEQKNVRAAIGQLSQASMEPHQAMLRSVASLVSSETTIPLGYLGVVHDQPSSADAILASESDMIAMIEGELPAIGWARADFARKCLAIMHGEWTDSMARDLRTLRGQFMNPGTPTLAARADAGQKFVTTFPDADPEVAMEIYGLTQDQRQRMAAYRAKSQAKDSVRDLLAGRQTGTQGILPVAANQPVSDGDANGVTA